MAVGVAYQTYQLTQVRQDRGEGEGKFNKNISKEGNLEASYPDFEEEGTVTHIYNKTDFCLIYLQVLLAPCKL